MERAGLGNFVASDLTSSSSVAVTEREEDEIVLEANEPSARVFTRDDLSVVGALESGAPAARHLGDPVSAGVRGVKDVRGLYRKITWGLAATDAASLCLALLSAWLVTFGLRSMHLDYMLVVLTAPVVWLAVFHGFGLYAPQHLGAAEEFRRTLGAASLGVLLVMVASFWFDSSFSRAWVGLVWVFAVAFEMTARHVWRIYQSRMKADGRLVFRTLIVGTNAEASRLAVAMQPKRTGFAPLGYIAASGPQVAPDRLQVVGRIESLPQAIRDHAAECVFVASTAVGAEDMLLVAQAARQEGVEVRVSANLPEILTSRLSVQQVGTAMALTVKPVQLTGSQTVIKRVFDVVVAGIVLLLSLPLFALIALAVRATSQGPVLFSQPRVTKGSRSFMMYKFRTMVRNADQVRVAESPDPTVPFFKPENDPRITKLGAWLRRLSLDELPQLWNVVRGDMSLVGPRPLPAEQVAANLELLRSRHEVPAGVTGWWQINGRSNLNPEQALRLDLFYIENWSLTLDLYVLLKTVTVMLAQRGAY